MIAAPTQSNILESLRRFLLAVLPTGVEVIAGQPNRVPEPVASSFVVMSPPAFDRLATNITEAADVKFTGSIAGTVMTVTDVAFGSIAIGATVFGVGVTDGTKVSSLGTGTGGIGTYNITPTQTVGSETLSSGAQQITQESEVTVQLDFHAANGSSGDMAQTVSTLLRDSFGVDQFAQQSPNYGISPLYADNPRQLPFINENQQVEWRWVVECHLQANQTVSVPQQYADSIDVTTISVDAAYPP